MSSDIIGSFIDAMCAAGCAPASSSDIKADDVSRYIDGAGDKKGSKKIKYVLKIDGSRGIGGFVHFRMGEWHTWTSAGDGEEWTEQEKADWSRRMEEERRHKKEQKEKEWLSVSNKARPIWEGAPLAPANHPYLLRKKIRPHGARVWDDKLLIPMYNGRNFWSYQTIDANGDKRFLTGARLSGCYFPIAHKDDNKDTIILCEGYATGASIREATGMVTVVCFIRSNLLPVARIYREKYPQAKIIIAADNDQWSPNGRHYEKIKKEIPQGFETHKDIPGDHEIWAKWRSNGWLENAGLKDAEQAAVKIGNAFTVPPVFPSGDPDKRTDFNDAHATQGLDVVADRLLGLPIGNPKKQITVDHDRSTTWADDALWKMDTSGNLKLDPSKSYNYFVLVEQHAELTGVFSWDEFQLAVMVIKAPPWESGEDFIAHKLNNNDIIRCDYYLQGLGMSGSTQNTRNAIYAAAMKNSMHPARDYFDSLVWDNEPRLDDWLIKYVNCRSDDAEYVRAVGRTWLIAAVKRVYEPGCKFDHMLILEGDQSLGKSTTLKIMATFGSDDHEKSYFNDTFQIKNLENKDELEKLRGALIVELQEMSGFNKKDRDALTAFVTTTVDEYRKAYGYENEKFPRQFVLAGTYNPIHGLFTDPTGYRRYWCVAVDKKIDFDGLKQAKEQLWAEAVYRYKSGESIYLSDALADKAHEAGKSRRVIDEWTYDVLNAFSYAKFMTVRDIMSAIGIDLKNRGQIESRRINSILKSEGFVRVQRRKGSTPVWGWERPDSSGEQIEAPLEDDSGEEIEF